MVKSIRKQIYKIFRKNFFTINTDKAEDGSCSWVSINFPLMINGEVTQASIEIGFDVTGNEIKDIHMYNEEKKIV